jgi:hypothetical protein
MCRSSFMGFCFFWGVVARFSRAGTMGNSKIDAIDRRAAALGMKRSDYLCWVIDKDLATA